MCCSQGQDEGQQQLRIDWEAEQAQLQRQHERDLQRLREGYETNQACGGVSAVLSALMLTGMDRKAVVTMSILSQYTLPCVRGSCNRAVKLTGRISGLLPGVVAYSEAMKCTHICLPYPASLLLHAKAAPGDAATTRQACAACTAMFGSSICTAELAHLA